MGVPRATALPDYGISGTINYDPEIYSGKLVEKFYKSTVFGEIASTDYEGEISAYGGSVKIRTIPDVSIADYVVGAGLTAAYPSSASVTLTIDKAKSFCVALTTVDARQSDIDMADVFANDASIQLRISADADVLTTIPAQVNASNQGNRAGADSANIQLGDSSSPFVLTSSNAVNYLVDCGTVLDEQNIPDEGRWFVGPPWMMGTLKKSDLRIASLSGDGVSIARNGKVGEVDRFTLYQSRNLLTQTSPGPATYVMFGHSAGLTFAAQIIENEMITNPNDFGYVIRGLMVYGFKTVNDKCLGMGVIARG